MTELHSVSLPWSNIINCHVTNHVIHLKLVKSIVVATIIITCNNTTLQSLFYRKKTFIRPQPRFHAEAKCAIFDMRITWIRVRI